MALSPLNDKTCNSDEECVFIAKPDPENPCCFICGEEVVNKQAEKERETWQEENCQGSDVSPCPRYRCAVPEKLPVAQCINNQCVIEWVER